MAGSLAITLLCSAALIATVHHEPGSVVLQIGRGANDANRVSRPSVDSDVVVPFETRSDVAPYWTPADFVHYVAWQIGWANDPPMIYLIDLIRSCVRPRSGSFADESAEDF